MKNLPVLRYNRVFFFGKIFYPGILVFNSWPTSLDKPLVASSLIGAGHSCQPLRFGRNDYDSGPDITLKFAALRFLIIMIRCRQTVISRCRVQNDECATLVVLYRVVSMQSYSLFWSFILPTGEYIGTLAEH
jgi:hypothetical protein